MHSIDEKYSFSQVDQNEMDIQSYLLCLQTKSRQKEGKQMFYL